MDFNGIVFKGDKSKFIESEDDYYDVISLYKDIDYFLDEVAYSKFVKHIENKVRTSPEYTAYIAWMKQVMGMDFCQVSSAIHGTDGVTIEMHHGPILTLYDIVSVILNDFIATGKKINSWRLTDAVLQEHFELRVQTVMLAKTNHEAAHNGDLFLNVSQGFGNIAEFIEMYHMRFDDLQKYKLWNYLNMCKANPSFDRGYLDIDHIQKYIKL